MRITNCKRVDLNNGKCLYLAYGGYMPQLSILCDGPIDEKNYDALYGTAFDDEGKQKLNVELGHRQQVRFFRGEYFVSKKGTQCFRIKADGPHWLIEEEWGGCDGRTIGFGHHLEKLPDIIYQKRCTSNGGGLGVDFVVVPVGAHREVSEDDI